MMWTWSLAVQGQFYVLFPILVKVFGLGRKLMVALVLMCIASLGYRVWMFINWIEPMPLLKEFMYELDDLPSFYTYFQVKSD